MKKLLILMIAVWLMELPAILFPQEEHKKIVEEVSVNWWQVPVFAVDEKGNPVNDLKPEDIEIIMNHRVIPTFSLDKRTFNVTERSQEVVRAAPAAAEQPPARNKAVFLLFDQALSGESATARAKIIAQTIITDVEKNTRFIVLTIDSMAGLVYIGEGSGDQKDRLVNMIKNKVKLKSTARSINIANIASDLRSVPGNTPNTGRAPKPKYEGEDFSLFMEAMSKAFKWKSMGFFHAFETLYYYLNAIEDNKFIYLFSEGMSNSILISNRSLAGERGAYYYYLKRVAKYLSRSGAVLFVINSMGVLRSAGSILSGEDSLDVLVEESGGTYLEGTPEKITERLTNIHHAYYEVSFPDAPQFKGKTREIAINSIRNGIKIFTLHSLEKRKPYNEMIPIEKEMLVLNLISQPPNPLIKGIIDAYNAQVEKTGKKPKSIVHTTTLPPGYLYKHLDLYKVWLAVDTQGIAQLEKIETEALYPKKNQLKIEFELNTGKEPKKAEPEKEPAAAETRAYFVLINKDAEPVRASVWGSEYYQEDPELEELEKTKTAKKTKGGKPIDPQEMQRILQGAAEYCERLKQSAFHFYCREKIVEAHNPLTESDSQQPNRVIGIAKPSNSLDLARVQAYAQVKDYEFGYRLIKQGTNITEERDFLSSSDKTKVSGDQVITANTFFTERTVFGPATVLDRCRQGSYNIRFIEFDEFKGRPAVVIEALPKKPAETPGTYGKIWIDRDDFSVLKIEANPQSIRGYDKLKAFAEKLHAKLYLTLESEFDEIFGGLRFPTKVRMSEKYKGGHSIQLHKSSRGWERTVTEFVYKDYQFFDVQTEVKVQK